MWHLWNIRWLLLHFLLAQLHIHYATTTWPSSNISSIQLLGLFPDADNASESETTTTSVHSRAMFKAAIILSQQFNITIEGQFIGWQSAQTGGDVIDALSRTCRIMTTSNIVGIVGPPFSREAHVIAAFAETIGIPAISYSASDPALSDQNAYPAFHRTIPSDYAAALAIVKLFVRYNWTSCNIIYQNDEFGNGGVDAITTEFNKNKLTVSETLLFDISTLNFRNDLKITLLTSSSRIVLVWADELYTSLILQYALDNDVLGPQFLWILSSSVSFDSFNQTFYQKLIGILTIEPAVGNAVDIAVNTTLLNAAYAIWQQYESETFPESTKVNDYALFAFDATWSLIQSLQKLCSTNINSSSSCLSFVDSSFCFDRRFLNHDSFFDAVSTTDFLGVSGPIQFSNSTTDRINGTYYIVRNVQPSGSNVNFISVLQLSGSGDWESTTQGSFIIWPGNLLTPPNGLPRLTGVSLRIGVVQSDPFTMITEVSDGSGQSTTKLIGYVPDLIDLLSTRMGFTSQIIIAPSNQSYNQHVQAVANNVYDMVVGDMTITAKRRDIVDFSSSIFDNSIRIIVRDTSDVKIDLLAFMKPFSGNLWLLIMGALLFAAVLICILERRENEALKERSIVSLVAMSVWYCFGTMVGYGVDFHVETAAGRLVTVALYILSIVLVASYTANLASDLTLSKSQNIISGIDDIKNGKIPYSRIGIISGSSLEDYYLREISGGSQNFYPLKDQSDIYSALLNHSIDASIMDTGVLEYATNTLYCNLTLIGSDFETSAFGIVIRKQWLYAQALDVNILSLRESGALNDLRKKWFEGSICSTSSGTDTSTQYTVNSLCGLFLTFTIISVLALLLFAWLKRIIVRDYLLKLAYRKSWLAEKEDSVRTLPTKHDYEPSQIWQSVSDLRLTIRL